MDVSVRTETKTSIARKGDKITIKEVDTTTTTRRGAPPEVKIVERVKEYNVHNIPDSVRSQIGDLALPDNNPSKKVRKFSSQGWVQKPSVSAPQSLESRLTSLPVATQIDAGEQAKLNDDCVRCHNEYRQMHGVPPLVYCKELADYAQNWAEDLAINQRFEHRKENGVGENLYMFHSSNPTTVATARDACNSWYSEIKSFTFGEEPKNLKAGHFTQMIWKESKKIGMGRARGPSGKQIIVANYDPPGNIFGSFTANVPPRIS